MAMIETSDPNVLGNPSGERGATCAKIIQTAIDSNGRRRATLWALVALAT